MRCAQQKQMMKLRCNDGNTWMLQGHLLGHVLPGWAPIRLTEPGIKHNTRQPLQWGMHHASTQPKANGALNMAHSAALTSSAISSQIMAVGAGSSGLGTGQAAVYRA